MSRYNSKDGAPGSIKNMVGASGLGTQYPMTSLSDAKKTKDRILIESIMLFSKRGYSDVSVKDIADAVGLRAASLYNHFNSKEAIWKECLDHIEKLYMMYFKRLEETKPHCLTFEEGVASMFVELKSVVNIFTYYAFSLVLTEQFRDEDAYRIVNKLFLGYSVDYIDDRFKEYVRLGFVNEFDTRTTARFFMQTVINGITIRAQADMGREMPYDPSAVFENLERYIIQAAKLGVGAEYYED